MNKVRILAISAMLAVFQPSLLMAQTVDERPAKSKSETAQFDQLSAQIDQVLTPDQVQFRDRISGALLERDPVKAIEAIDALLPVLDSNSHASIILRAHRARKLVFQGEVQAGKAAFEKLLAEHFQYPVIWYQAIDGFAYTSAADFAARLWIQLTQFPEVARLLGGSTLSALVGNLEANGYFDLRDELYLHLDKIDYDPGTTAQRNNMQYVLFKQAAVRDDSKDEARAALRKIIDPEILISIASQKKYEDFWGEIDLSPSALNNDAKACLTALQQDFLKPFAGEAAHQYISAALAFTGPNAVASAFGPVLDRLIARAGEDKHLSGELPYWISPISGAWQGSGSPERAEQLFKDAFRAFSQDHGGIKLNISSNYARFLMEEGRLQEALPLIESSIEELNALDLSRDSLSPMHAVRLRIYHGLGMPEKAEDSRLNLEKAKSVQIRVYSDTMLAIDEYEAARSAVIAMLGSNEADIAIAYLQKPIGNLITAAARDAETRRDLLRDDPAVIMALQKVGRIVDVEPIAVENFDHASAVLAFEAQIGG